MLTYNKNFVLSINVLNVYLCFTIFTHSQNIFFCDSIKSHNEQKLSVELQQSKPGQLELPKLRKVVKDEKEQEKKKEEADLKAVKKTVKKKKGSDYELPVIPDYERPELEKYEKNDFNPNDRVSLNIEKVRKISILPSLYHYISKKVFLSSYPIA